MDPYIGAAYDSPLLIRALFLPLILVGLFGGLGVWVGYQFGRKVIGSYPSLRDLEGKMGFLVLFIAAGIATAVIWTALICGVAVVIFWAIICGVIYFILKLK
jgi:hypothetical protein